MPVNPNQASVTLTPTSLPTLSLQLRQFDKEASLLITGAGATNVQGILYGSTDNVNWYAIGCIAYSNGQTLASGLSVATFPGAFWINVAPWDYLQFVPSAMAGTTATLQLLSDVSLGGAPPAAAQFNQNQALILALSDINSTDYLAGVGGTF